MDLLYPVYEFRPAPGVLRPGFEVFRFADGQWIPDDGEHDLAFVANNTCLMVDLPHRRNIIWKWVSAHWTSPEYRHPNANPWHYMLREGETEWGGDWPRDQHPNTKAGRSGMSWACEQYRCASGHHVNLLLGDKHIAAGLVRDRETKQVLTFPEKPCCMFCRDDGTAALARLNHEAA